MIDLSNYLHKTEDIEDTANVLNNLGYKIIQENDKTIVNASDPSRLKLLAQLQEGKLPILKFIDESRKISSKEMNKERGPVILVNGKQIPIPNENFEEICLDVKQIDLSKMENKTADMNLPAVENIDNQSIPVEETTDEEKDNAVGSIWRDLPPADKEDWAEVNISNYIDHSNGWAIVGASRRGKTHAHEGSHRDDSFAFDFINGWSILAVADGAGSCRLSRVGSKISCFKAVESLKTCLTDFKVAEIEGLEIPDQKDLLQLKDFLKNAMKSAIQAVNEEAAKRKIENNLLSTTLLLVVHHAWGNKNIVASIQVGDGAISIWHEGKSVTILGAADSGIYASETTFITSNEIENELDYRVFFAIKPGVNAVAAMTDGVADDFFPYDKVMPEMFEELCENVLESDNPGETLLKWLAYERRGSFDDRTIVMLHRR